MLSNFTRLVFTSLTALFPSFCHASFGLWFTARRWGRGACLLTLSPEGAGRKLTITMSKYVHAKSTLLKGIVGCLLAGLWPHGPPHLQLLYFFHVWVLTAVTDAALPACTVAFFFFFFCPSESNKPCSHSPTESLSCPGWRGRVCPASCRT